MVAVEIGAVLEGGLSGGCRGGSDSCGDGRCIRDSYGPSKKGSEEVRTGR